MTRCVQVLIVVCSVFTTACRGGAPPAGEAGAKPAETKAPKDQVVLTPDEQKTGNIETQPVQPMGASEVLRVSGRIARADDRTFRVGVRTSGLVRSVFVSVGDAVRAGQILARYHADEVREERAKYRTALSELREREAAATLAKRNFDRMQTLLELKAASVQQVDQARQDLVAAESNVQNAQTEVERAKDVLEDELHVPVESKAGNAEADQVPIFAPAAGSVLEKDITPGRTVAPGQDVFVIGDLSQVWMLASVRQDALDHLRVGQAVNVIVTGVGGERFVGKVTNLGQELDSTTRAMPVRIVLDNSDQRLRPEMLATAEIPFGETTSVLAVPSDAIQQINGQDVVFVRTAADRFSVRPVRIGPTANGKTRVLEGLKAGDEIVVHGSFTIKSHLLRSTMEGE